MHEAHLEGNICIVVHAKYLWVVRERQAVHVMPVLLDGVLFRCIVETCMGPVAVRVCVCVGGGTVNVCRARLLHCAPEGGAAWVLC